MSVFIGNKSKRVELAERKDAINPNLFTGSKDFTGDWINLDQVKQKDKYLDFTAVYEDWQWGGISQYIAVNKGETFTASAYVKAKAGSQIYWYTNLNNDNEDGHTKADTNPTGQAITATGDWQKTSITFTANSDGTIKPRIETGDSTVPFWIAGMKLEKGPVATDWCPALEDYAWEPDITNLQNAVNQLKGRQTVDAPDFNTLTDTGVYMISNPDKGKNYPITSWGTLAVFNGTNGSDTMPIQIYVCADGASGTFVRLYGFNGTNHDWWSWNQVAWKSDITNLQNTIQANKTDVSNLQSMITGLSTKVDSLQKNSLKIVPITQAAYDTLSTKDSNTIYAIGG